MRLRFTGSAGGTQMAAEHQGPLRVQKALYPEGRGVCHAIVLHPPGGIVGGDRLRIGVTAEPGAQALLTTPGAGKLYRSGGPAASVEVGISVGDGACLEWLPQETIVYDGARARVTLAVELAPQAAWIGWEILCWGRPAAGAPFRAGEVCLATRVDRAGRPLWRERARVAGGSPFGDAPTGLAGATVSGTMLAVSGAVSAELVSACRSVAARDATGAAVTRLPGVLVARFVGASAEAAREYFVALWRLVRPALCGREAAPPRIWNT